MSHLCAWCISSLELFWIWLLYKNVHTTATPALSYSLYQRFVMTVYPQPCIFIYKLQIPCMNLIHQLSAHLGTYLQMYIWVCVCTAHQWTCCVRPHWVHRHKAFVLNVCLVKAIKMSYVSAAVKLTQFTLLLQQLFAELQDLIPFCFGKDRRKSNLLIVGSPWAWNLVSMEAPKVCHKMKIMFEFLAWEQLL